MKKRATHIHLEAVAAERKHELMNIYFELRKIHELCLAEKSDSHNSYITSKKFAIIATLIDHLFNRAKTIDLNDYEAHQPIGLTNTTSLTKLNEFQKENTQVADYTKEDSLSDLGRSLRNLFILGDE